MKIKWRKLGLGSLSPVLFIISFYFSLSTKNNPSIGDRILNFVGLPSWSRGTEGLHFTVLYSFGMILLSVYWGLKYPDDFGAKLGEWMAKILFVFIFIYASISLIVGIATLFNNSFLI